MGHGYRAWREGGLRDKAQHARTPSCRPRRSHVSGRFCSEGGGCANSGAGLGRRHSSGCVRFVHGAVGGRVVVVASPDGEGVRRWSLDRRYLPCSVWVCVVCVCLGAGLLAAWDGMGWMDDGREGVRDGGLGCARCRATSRDSCYVLAARPLRRACLQVWTAVACRYRLAWVGVDWREMVCWIGVVGVQSRVSRLRTCARWEVLCSAMLDGAEVLCFCLCMCRER